MKKMTEPDRGKQCKERNFRNRNKRKYKHKKNGKQTKRNFEKGYQQQQEQCSAGNFVRPAASCPIPSVPAMKNAHNLWTRTYQNIVRWHCQHQSNYWRNRAFELRAENARLRRRLAVQDSEDEDAEAAIHERQQQQPERQEAVSVAPADDADADEALDEEFIAFMEVSARHRQERRRLKNESVH
ncbi:uncharacterized protein LOC129777245 [Toxorhynchites rutilus septentrionalis]|uniref:uncharacterized protein LOC129777245 n=1 Tax=Toxorhynchites rutilus septentrionalis TaxID=329112 RepID=UPI0024783370|nr:uncharacterized protein LOC129777245 [Toxorhynchites rutilus septentrionalis]